MNSLWWGVGPSYCNVRPNETDATRDPSHSGGDWKVTKPPIAVQWSSFGGGCPPRVLRLSWHSLA